MKARFLIPLVAFLALLGLFYVGLGLNPREVPSPLIDKAAPQFNLAQLHEPEKTIGTADFRGQVVMLNVWASWCVACRQEHPLLVEISKRNEVPIYGLNYKDEPADAKNWLDRLGNPYLVSAADRDGRVGIDWGVYGVPETFVVDKKGVIRYKQIGPITLDAWNNKIKPLVEQLRQEQG